MVKTGWWFWLFALVAACAIPSHADVTFLLQEPYGHLGGLSPTGHAALYLSRICADSPTELRMCAKGETGVVISRYRTVAGYDWIAIPLVPYLYAVEDAAAVPERAERNTVAELRDAYRRRRLWEIAPDEEDGSAPGGSWPELIGAAYNRRMFAFQMTTTEEQDKRLLARLNARPNKKRFNFFFRNCADFAREVINGYFPKAVRRSYIADMGLMTPKQVAKSLMKYDRKHAEVNLSIYVIPQIPGSMDHSSAIRGVAESLVRTKKYLVPLAVFHPFVTGGLAAAYVAKGRFNPGTAATVISSAEELELISRTREEVAAQAGEGEGMPSLGVTALYDMIEWPDPVKPR